MEKNSNLQVSFSRLLVPAMVIGSMSVNVSISILQLFMVEISNTFHVSVGVASQIATVNFAGEFVSALMMGALAVRFRHKPLILAGMLLVLFSALGSFFATNLGTMEVFFALEGFGTIIFVVMSRTVIGDAFASAPQRRAKAVSYLVAAGMGMALLSLPLSGFFANVAGWRSNFMLQTLPLALFGLALTLFAVPSNLSKQPAGFIEKNSVRESFRHVLKDRSATACLVSQLFAAAGTSYLIYVMAFLRGRFSASLNFTVLISMVSLVLFIFGTLVAGRLVGRFGAKPTTVSTTFAFSILMIVYFVMPNLWTTLANGFVSSWFAGVSYTSYVCLAITQTPESRGTMMSLTSVVESGGSAIGPALAGTLLALTLGFYEAVGLLFGGLFLIAAIMRLFWVEEPTSARER